MKILIIQPWISYRGAESVSLDEAQGLKILGNEVKILCLYAEKDKLKENDRKIEFILPPKLISRFCQRSNIFFFIFGFFILLILMLLKGRKFDIYNPHNFPSPWVCVITSFLYKKPVFWTVHNFPQHNFTNPYGAKLWGLLIFWFDQYLIRRVDGAICVSEKVHDQVYKFYRMRSKVIYPPVDVKFFSQGNKEGAEKILNVSNFSIVLIPSKLHSLKNLEFALKVLKKISEKNKKVLFVFAGEGPILPKLKEYCNINNLNMQVRFLGLLSKEKLRDFYKASDLIFLPGFYGEGFNISVLEALSSRKLSVVLKGSGIDAWVVKNKVGFVIDKSEEKAAKLFLKLFDDKKNLSKIAINKQKMLNDYSIRNYAQNLIDEFFNKLL